MEEFLQVIYFNVSASAENSGGGCLPLQLHKMPRFSLMTSTASLLSRQESDHENTGFFYCHGPKNTLTDTLYVKKKGFSKKVIRKI